MRVSLGSEPDRAIGLADPEYRALRHVEIVGDDRHGPGLPVVQLRRGGLPRPVAVVDA